ncbi:SDR family NAD(P)-dependent oxidoreductase [Phreatobacter sp.]|uniref:SDR family NAD(P)-dependent oxidoreductase n=1 Tax=Phreatobacter sp. TaxID=1966341 RepID=UPI003F706953
MPKDCVAITGGASGIGLASAAACVARGWKVAVCDRDIRALAAAETRLGDRATYTAVDVTDETAVEAWIEAAAGQGRLIGCVTSAGRGADVPALQTGADLFRAIHEVNVLGTFLAAKAAARVMQDTGGGSIVTIASVSGVRGSKGRVAYGSSKAAVINMTQVLAVDLAHKGIRVNAVCPGPVETPMVAEIHDQATRDHWLRHVPMRRYGTVDEIASLVAFLLDETQSSFVTGQAIAADGGFAGAGLTSLQG